MMGKRNLLASICCLCILLAGWLPGQKRTSLEQDIEMLRRYHSALPAASSGLALAAAGKWEQAGKDLDRCLAILPGHPNAAYGKAVIANQGGGDRRGARLDRAGRKGLSRAAAGVDEPEDELAVDIQG